MLPIEIQSLSRSYGRRAALIDLSLTVKSGEIVALVGPNGSGKTTLLKILAGLLRPGGGRVALFGLDPFRDRVRVMARARFAFAPPALFDNLTAREHLRYLIGFHGDHRVSPAEIDQALELVGLTERSRERVAVYSLGMRQRLALAQALLPLPDLLVLDEPTEGLDPLAVLELRAVVARLRREHGVAVLLSSHLMVEVEQLVDRLLVLSEGLCVYLGTPSGLTEGACGLRVVAGDPKRAAPLFRARGATVSELKDGALLVRGVDLDLKAALALLEPAGVELRSFSHYRPTLEQALLERLRAHTAAGRRDA